MEFISDPAFIGGLLRVVFWFGVAMGIALLLRVVPDQVRRILTYRLF